MRGSLLLLTISVLTSCVSATAPAATTETIVAEPVAVTPPPHCSFPGPGRVGRLEVDGENVIAWGTVREGTLRGERLDLHLESEGWHVLGALDAWETPVLRLRQTMWLAEGVFAQGGFLVRVRGGEQGVDVRLTGALADRLSFVESPQRRVGCAAIGWESDGAAAQTPPDLPIGEDLESAVIERDRFALAHAPGGEPFVRYSPDHPRGVFRETVGVTVLERRGEHVRVLAIVWAEGTSAHLVGWIEAAALEAPNGGLGLMGGLGSLAMTFDHHVCRAEESLELGAVVGARTLSLGYVDAGAALDVVPGVDLSTPPTDGRIRVTPPRGLHLAEGVHPFVLQTARLAFELEEGSAERRSYGLEVTRSEGLGCEGAGCSCQLELFRYRNVPRCRAELRCGERALFGAQPFNGFFDCDADVTGEVRGTDDEPSDADGGDARFSLDTAAGTVSASDDEHAREGAFVLEARIRR